ncbi:MAG: hypothetical protein GQ542_16420 [Desulforhopalus sp.]|jgi:uncharacterized tellurite resistance protein B-like protein|nr:hypothetical protein [Desulforhopalus sp.]
MFDLIKKIIGKTTKEKTTNNDNAQDAHIALCVLLLETAHVDGECSDEEMEHIVSTLTTECGVPRQEIDELIASSHQHRNDSVDLFRFTRYMNNNFTKDQKISVMESVWRIIHLDAHLKAHEDHFAHKLANLLRLTHTDLINAKIKAREQLA